MHIASLSQNLNAIVRSKETNKNERKYFSFRWEGFGNVLLEAMTRIQVISTNCASGPAEILENGKYGCLIPVSDVDFLTKAIEETLDAPFSAEILHSRATDFSLEKIGKEYLRVMGLTKISQCEK